MYDEEQALKVLHDIWSHSAGDYVHLPRRRGKTWSEVSGHIGDVMPEHLGQDKYEDIYFSPLRFRTTGRRLEDVGTPGVLFADLDEAPDWGEPFPHIIWNTSPRCRQAVWFLTEPTPVIKLWRTVNRQLTYFTGADRGGWMENKVLRIPGSANWKRATNGVPAWGGNVIYNDGPPVVLRALNTALPAVKVVDDTIPTPLAALTNSSQLPERPELTLSLEYWMRITPEEYRRVRKPDRSMLIWKTARALNKAGVSREDCHRLIFSRPWCKWPNNPERLWMQVCRAYSSDT